MTKPVFLHAGAHRTGTSSFQMCLAVNRPALSAAGFDLAYPGRDDIPGAQLKLKLPRGQVRPHRWPEFSAGMHKHLARISPKKDRSLILSEENLPGPMRHFYTGAFFPHANPRLQAFSKALWGRPQHVVFVVRSYDALFRSAFRKRAEDNPVPDFSTLLPRFRSIETGWVELIHLMVNALQPERFTVLSYDKRGSSVELLRTLVPDLESTDLVEPARLMNVSVTDAGLIALQNEYRQGATLTRPEWQALAADYAGQTEDLGFTKWDPETQNMLRDRYARDLEAISDIPGLTFIR